MHFIGCVHIDIFGMERLLAALHHLQPKKIAVEWPSDFTLSEIAELDFDWNEIDRMVEEKEEFSELPEDFLPLVKRQLFSSRYELRGSLRYAQQTGAEILPVDHPEITSILSIRQREKIEYTHSTYLPGFIDHLEEKPMIVDLISEYSKFVDLGYTSPLLLADRTWESIEDIEEEFGLTESLDADVERAEEELTSTFMAEREQHIAQGIRTSNSEVYVGGLLHSTAEVDEENEFHDWALAYNLLADLQPERSMLKDYSSLVVVGA